MEDMERKRGEGGKKEKNERADSQGRKKEIEE